MKYEISPMGPSYPMTVISLVMIISLVFFVMMMVWVYKDAKQRNMEPVLYLVLVFFFGCCGLMIYFIARAEHPAGEQVGTYGTQEPRIDTTHRGQPLYGQPQYAQTRAPPSPQPQKLSHNSKFCKYCGGEMPNDARFCSICGANEFNH